MMNYVKLMNCLKLMSLCFILINTGNVLAVTRVSSFHTGKVVPTLKTEFGITGTVDKVDPQGRWIQINNKKYILNGTGSLGPGDLQQGMSVHYNVEKAFNEKMGRVTRIWVE